MLRTRRDHFEEDSPRRITKKLLLGVCNKNGLYTTPHLNETLYLHFMGLTKIENLEEYTGLLSLWLQNNAIRKIENLDRQSELRCLYLHQNLLDSIDNLDPLQNLQTINVSNNFITRIDNLSCLPCLHTLEMSRNKLVSISDVLHLKECPSLAVVDLSYNYIDDPAVLDVFAAMLSLRILNMTGNPVLRHMKNYRRNFIFGIKNLCYLDDQPVTDRDRACVMAWSVGGIEAEREERIRWKKMDADRIQRSVDAVLALKKRKTLTLETEEERERRNLENGGKLPRSESDNSLPEKLPEGPPGNILDSGESREMDADVVSRRDDSVCGSNLIDSAENNNAKENVESNIKVAVADENNNKKVSDNDMIESGVGSTITDDLRHLKEVATDGTNRTPCDKIGNQKVSDNYTIKTDARGMAAKGTYDTKEQSNEERDRTSPDETYFEDKSENVEVAPDTVNDCDPNNRFIKHISEKSYVEDANDNPHIVTDVSYMVNVSAAHLKITSTDEHLSATHNHNFRIQTDAANGTSGDSSVAVAASLKHVDSDKKDNRIIMTATPDAYSPRSFNETCEDVAPKDVDPSQKLEDTFFNGYRLVSDNDLESLTEQLVEIGASFSEICIQNGKIVKVKGDESAELRDADSKRSEISEKEAVKSKPIAQNPVKQIPNTGNEVKEIETGKSDESGQYDPKASETAKNLNVDEVLAKCDRGFSDAIKVKSRCSGEGESKRKLNLARDIDDNSAFVTEVRITNGNVFSSDEIREIPISPIIEILTTGTPIVECVGVNTILEEQKNEDIAGKEQKLGSIQNTSDESDVSDTCLTRITEKVEVPKHSESEKNIDASIPEEEVARQSSPKVIESIQSKIKAFFCVEKKGMGSQTSSGRKRDSDDICRFITLLENSDAVSKSEFESGGCRTDLLPGPVGHRSGPSPGVLGCEPETSSRLLTTERELEKAADAAEDCIQSEAESNLNDNSLHPSATANVLPNVGEFKCAGTTSEGVPADLPKIEEYKCLETLLDSFTAFRPSAAENEGLGTASDSFLAVPSREGENDIPIIDGFLRSDQTQNEALISDEELENLAFQILEDQQARKDLSSLIESGDLGVSRDSYQTFTASDETTFRTCLTDDEKYLIESTTEFGLENGSSGRLDFDNRNENVIRADFSGEGTETNLENGANVGRDRVRSSRNILESHHTQRADGGRVESQPEFSMSSSSSRRSEPLQRIFGDNRGCRVPRPLPNMLDLGLQDGGDFGTSEARGSDAIDGGRLFTQRQTPEKGRRVDTLLIEEIED